MQIGGTLVSGVVRILVVVATLAAVYYFLLRPVLDTTEKVSGGITSSMSQISIPDDIQQQVEAHVNSSSSFDSDRFNACIEKAQQAALSGRYQRVQRIALRCSNQASQ